MTDDRSWLTDDYPELRDGPPWVMEDMILEERDLPVGILPHMEAIVRWHFGPDATEGFE